MSEIANPQVSESGSPGMGGATGAGRGVSARAGGEFGADGASPSPVCGVAPDASASDPGHLAFLPNLPPAAVGVPAALFGGRSHFTPAGLERLRAAAKATLQNPEVAARRHAAQEAKRAWSDETKAQVRQWAAEGMPVRQIARRLGVHFDTAKRRAAMYGIALRDEVKGRYARAADLLKLHYPSTMLLPEILRLYREAVGRDVTMDAMETYARKLGLRRPPNVGRRAGAAVRQAGLRGEREALAPAIQEMLNRHASFDAISAALGVSQQRLQRMRKEGLIHRVPKPPAEPKKRVRAARPPKPAKPAKVAAPKPKRLPASWVRAEPAPPKPKMVFETVDAFLAAGGRITRCPIVALEPTQARIPEADRLAMQAIYAERAAAAPKGGRGAALKSVMVARGRAQGRLK